MNLNIYLLKLALIFGIAHSGIGQGRFEVEGNGDQLIRIESLNDHITGIDFIQSQGQLPNWRILNSSIESDLIFYLNGLDDFETPGNEVLRLSHNGLIGIDSPLPLSKLHIENGSPASLASHGFLMLGAENDNNLIFDNDGIIARNNGSASRLLIQSEGGSTVLHPVLGNVGIGNGFLAHPQSRLHIANGDNASLVSNGFMMLGLSFSENLVVDKSLLQARNNGSAEDMYIQGFGGNLGVGVTLGQSPLSSLQVFQGTPVSLATHGLLMLGRQGSENLVFDTNDIQARAGTTAVGLNLNRFGNNVGIGVSSGLPLSKLHIEGGNNALLNSDGFLMLGNKNGVNLVVDNKQLQSRNNGLTTSLTLQHDGGDVIMTPLGVNNQVGIGTTLPEEKLHIRSTEWQALLQHQNNANKWYMGASDVNWGVNSENLFIISSTGASFTGLLYLDRSKQAMGIGTYEIPDGYKVAVDGSVVCEEVLVALEIDWPDYVFSTEYQLQPLKELEKEIQFLGHLPGIPSAQEVEEKGIHVGSMHAKLLEKIEELTLHVIRLQKQNDEFRNEMDVLKIKNSKSND